MDPLEGDNVHRTAQPMKDYFDGTVFHTVEDITDRDFTPISPTEKDRPDIKRARPSVVSFTSQPTLRPALKSRMSTHRPDHSTANLAEMLHNGGSHGLCDVDVDYFKTVIEVFKDKQNHHSPVVFDFMLLHEVNIHHLEHRLLAEWDWLVNALSGETEERSEFAEQAPRRLDEIRELLHKYSVALNDFEQMRQRTTIDDTANPLRQSSWHSRMLRVGSALQPKNDDRRGAISRIYGALRRASLAGLDIEKDHHGEAPKPKSPLFGTTQPACRQLAGVEDWKRELDHRELDEQAKKVAVRQEWMASRFKRFSMAVFAGLALISPMILMSLVQTRTCALSTTSLAVLLFALVITYLTDMPDKDIVISTAGYAAVLVVFVGAVTSFSPVVLEHQT